MSTSKRTSKAPTANPSIADWILASRPMYFTAAVIPIVLGSALAASNGAFSLSLFVPMLIGAVLLQAAVNYLNTYGDFKSGVDTRESVDPVNAHLIEGKIDAEAMKRVGLGCIVAAGLCGAAPMYYGGLPVFVCGVLGAVGAACYTTFGAYKYCALGVPFVFFLMGPLMVVPAWFVMMSAAEGEGETPSVAVPIICSLPVALLVANIMHGNDVRDIEHDKAAGIRTPAMLMGRPLGIVLYKAFIVLAYASLFFAVFTGLMGLPALLPCVLLPLAFKTISGLSAKSERARIASLVEIAGQMHCLFGLLLCVGVLISIWI